MKKLFEFRRRKQIYVLAFYNTHTKEKENAGI